MSQQRRPAENIANKADIGSGPYLARIISHYDPSFMGGLEVTLLREQANEMGADAQTYIVKCASPFFGYTPYEFMGQNDGSNKTLDGYNDTQKSYGMWMVPPDTGVTVIVVFIDGDPSQGYWIGCVPSKFANHMVPAIGASDKVDLDAADKKKYNTKQPLPVAEVNRRLNGKNDQQVDVEKIKKVLHPIAEHFLEQGLIEDDVRGSTTTSSRREAPSMVFGISTPGPLDRRPGAKKAKIGTKDSPTNTPIPVSRLGGTQLVMDDGDARYQRKKPAGVGPVEYADSLNGEKGDPTIPYNEYFRVRTRTGHQILMHNSEDLIYISNSKGTAWVELTSNGKIDIYAEDTISIHSKADINMRADRDINFEAGRNVNIKSLAALNLESVANTEIVVGANGFITTTGNFDLKTTGDNKLSSTGALDINSGAATKITAGGDASIGAANLIFTGGKIDLNGPAAPEAAMATAAKSLPTYDNPVTNSSAGWAKKYQDGTLKSIMRRIPMHEPWVLHENQAPAQLTPDNVDSGLKENE